MAGKDAVLAAVGPQNIMRPTDLMASIRAEMGALRPAVIVLDTLADLFAGNENDRAQVRQFVGMLRGIAIDYQCGVVVLAHPSKSGMASGDGSSGSTAWSNSVRSRLYLDRVRDDDLADPDERLLKRVKANYASIDDQITLRWVDNVFIPMVVSGDYAVNAEKMAKWEHVFMTLLDSFTEQGRQVSDKRSNAFAPKLFAEHPDADGVTKTQFNKAMESLLMRKVICTRIEGPPSRQHNVIYRQTSD